MSLMDISQHLEIRFWMTMVALMQDSRFVRYFPPAALVVVLTLGVFFTTAATGGLDRGKAEEGAVGFQQRASNQYDALIIIVDHLDETQAGHKPALQGAWLAAYLPTAPSLTFLPLYPIPNDAAAELSLEREFGLGPDGKPVPAFLEALQSREVHWDNYFVLDESALFSLVDLAGGVALDEGEIDDPDRVIRRALYAEQPQGQAELADALCRRSGYLLANIYSPNIYSPNIGPITALGGLMGHMSTDLDWLKLAAGLGRLSDYTFNFTCEFPTLADRR